MLSILRSLFTLVKFLVLSYVYVVISCMVRATKPGPFLIRLLAAAGAAVLIVVPLLALRPLVSPLLEPLSRLPNPFSTQPRPAVWQLEPDFPPLPSPGEAATVVTAFRVINGDSLEVSIGADFERVRLLGIDSPEEEMCFGSEAALRVDSLLELSTPITLEADPGQPNRDKFGRLYRYVRLADGRLLNQVLVEEGYAFEYTYFTPYREQAAFQQAEQSARAGDRGLWSENACGGQGERPERIIQPLALPMPAGLVEAEVVHVRDGDTVEVDIGGIVEPIRLIGIDTPEVGRCFYQEATDRITELIGGQTVWLEIDPVQGDRDHYRRLLRYIWMADGRMVNAVLVREGYAYEYTFRTRYHYEPAFMQLEHEAHYNNRGLWAPQTCDGQAGRRWSNAYNAN